MDLGAILPHTQLFGGVKRFLDLGEVFISMGHRFTLFTPEGKAPEWYNFKGKTEPLSKLSQYRLDALFLTEVKFLDELENSNSKRKFYYHVKEDDSLKYLSKYKHVEVLACSSNIYDYDTKRFGQKITKAIGGIDLKKYSVKPPKEEAVVPLTIMVYGRISHRKKGTHIVVSACERIYRHRGNIRLLLFDSPLDDKSRAKIQKFRSSMPFDFVLNHPFDKNNELFHRADIFVSAEKGAGWANTVAEAMACGIPVVATQSGTKDLVTPNETGILVKRNRWSVRKGIETLLDDAAKRRQMAQNGRKKVEQYDWHKLAEAILEHINHSS